MTHQWTDIEQHVQISAIAHNGKSQPGAQPLPGHFAHRCKGANRPPEGGRFRAEIYRPYSFKGLPSIKPVTAGTLTPTYSESDEPEHEKDSCRYPQKMYCEPGSKQNQDEQQRKNQYHRTASLFMKHLDVPLPSTSNQLDVQRCPGRRQRRSAADEYSPPPSQ